MEKCERTTILEPNRLNTNVNNAKLDISAKHYCEILNKLEIPTIIKSNQFTEKMVCDESGNLEIKVKLSYIDFTNENPENLAVTVSLIEKGNAKVYIPILATKTKPKSSERFISLVAYFTYCSDGTYIATFKICIKRAAKDIRFFVTANNCEPARSNAFSVYSMKKNNRNTEKINITSTRILPPIEQMTINSSMDSNVKIYRVIPNFFIENMPTREAVIIGDNLAMGANKIYFGELEASIQNVNPSYIIVTIPSQSTGSVDITINKNRNTGIVIFNYISNGN